LALQNNDGRPRRGRVFKEELHKINDRISAREVRLVGEGIEQGVYSLREALKNCRRNGIGFGGNFSQCRAARL
jgi:translation initiation factor IF-3